MKKKITFFLQCLLVFSFCCDYPENILTEKPTKNLFFDIDTLSWDTTITQAIFITQRVKLYNPNKNKVRIKKIALQGIKNSGFELLIDGYMKNAIENTTILGGDSILILATLKEENKEQKNIREVHNSIIANLENFPEIKTALIAWVKDPIVFQEEIISKDEIWDSPRPYLIKKEVIVEAGNRLTIKEGTEIYFDKEAKISILGSIAANGEKEKRIVFQSIRKDKYYRDTPQQWDGIYIQNTQSPQIFHYTTIRNSQYGVYYSNTNFEKPGSLHMTHTLIENISKTGLLTDGVNVTLINSIIHNSQEELLHIKNATNIKALHNTLVSLFLSRNFNATSFIIENKEVKNTNFIFYNNILWGYAENEWTYDGVNTDHINYNIIKTNTNILNKKNRNINPMFFDISSREYTLTQNSPAINQGTITEVKIDFDGNPRKNNPDIGAFEYISK